MLTTARVRLRDTAQYGERMAAATSGGKAFPRSRGRWRLEDPVECVESFDEFMHVAVSLGHLEWPPGELDSGGMTIRRQEVGIRSLQK